jgi:Bacterial Ig-like domain (group 3)/FG-GAP-like repeat
MFSRNGSPRLRRISHTPSRAHVSRIGISHLSRLFDLSINRKRLCGWVKLGLCVVALAPLACLTGCLGSSPLKSAIVALSPLAGVKPNLVAPPSNPFQGNATSVGNDASDATAASAGVPGTVLVRQSDCSVAGAVYTNIAFTTMNGFTGTFSGTFTSTITPNYGSTLHNLAGLTTTAGTFANGCTDKTAGNAGHAAALLAKTTAGLYVGASTDISNNLYIGAINPAAGTFTATRLSLTNVFSMYVGDVNSEGVGQLIVQSFVASTTGGFPTDTVFTINVHADGTSDTPVQIATPYPQFSLVVDDVNSDGKLDLIFGPQTFSSAAITVLPGTGNGTFGAPISSVTVKAAGVPPLTGDFNGDGKRDLVLGNVLFGNGDGTFTLGPVAPGASDPTVNFAIGDFNKDGKDDIAVYTPNGISIDLSNGDGTFTAFGPTYAGINGAFTLDVTDIDGDGNLDLVVGQGQSGIYLPPMNGQGIIMILMGNGDGTFRGAPDYPQAAGGGNHGAFAAGDFNNDGNIDVLSIASKQGNVPNGLLLLTGNGKGALTPQTINTSVVPSFVAAADIDGDGKLDAVTLTSTTDNSGNVNLALVTLKGNGDGTFATPVSYPVGTPPPNGGFSSSNLALGDTSATGKPDAVVYQNGSLYLLENNGAGTFASPVLIDTENGFQALAVADVNGDGKADIVALTSTQVNPITFTNSLLVYLSQGNGTFAAPVTVAASLTDAADIIVSDVNKDGKPDIVLLTSNSNTGASSLTSYPGHGDGTFAAGVNSTLAAGQALVSLAAADVNGDGNPDMLIGACCGNTLASIAFGNGDGTFAANYGISIGPSTNAVGFADLNNDGRPDLLLATNGNLVTSLNEFGSASTTLAPTITTLTLSPTAPRAGQSVTFSATVAPTTGSGTPTGTVTFLDGAVTLGTGTLSSGTASFTGSLAAGTHSITASYGGDTTYAGSVSAADNLTIGSASTLAPTATQLTASPTTASSGTTINFKASVSETSGTATPTGTVTFSDGTTVIGTGSLAAGVATFSTSALSVGTHNITAAYGGDTANAASTSSTFVITITAATPADFTISLSPSTGSVSPGSSATSTITITPSGGFSQAISLACSGLPADSTCTFSSPSVTPNGTAASTSTLTIATDVKTASLSTKPLRTPGGATSLAMLAGGGSLVLLLLRRRRKDPRLWLLQMGLVAAFVFASAMIGCGNSASATNKTPTGTSQITVTATAGSMVHTATYSLTVQ